MSKKIRDIISHIRETLKQNDIIEFKLESNLIIQEVLDISLEKLILSYDIDINEEQYSAIITLVNRRINKEPIAYIFGYKYFWKYKFYVDQGSLIPRPDSEVIIESVLNYFSDKLRSLNILEIGVGSGCLIISLLKEYKNAKATAIDISSEAIKVANHNMKKLLVEDRLKLINCPLENFDLSNDEYNIIISNPPYINHDEINALSSDVKLYEPHTALSGGSDGLIFYRKIAEKIYKYNIVNTVLCLEFGLNQHNDIINIFKKYNFLRYKIHYDLNNRERCLVFFL